jgi:predicted PurR-regulated permease PerM
LSRPSDAGAALRRRPRARPAAEPGAFGPPGAAGVSLRARVAWGLAFAAAFGVLVWVLRPVFAILAASAGLAYILDPVADWLERRGLSREGAIGVIFLSAFFTALLTVLILLPMFGHELEQIRARVVPAMANLDTQIEPWLARLSAATGRTIELDLAQLQAQAPAWVAEEWPSLQERLTAVGKGLLTQGLGLLNAALNITLMPIFLYYLLLEWDRMVASVHALVPLPFRPRVERVAREVDRRLSAFVRGQITVAAIMAVLYSVGLLIVGVDLALPVGLLSGLLFVVPYLGTAVGVVLGLVLALVKFGLSWHLGGVVAVFVVVQVIEGYLLTPKIVGEQVGLHPLVVMIALIVGGSLLGIWGMLIAIPVTAVLSVIGGEWLDLYRRSRVYLGSP